MFIEQQFILLKAINLSFFGTILLLVYTRCFFLNSANNRTGYFKWNLFRFTFSSSTYIFIQAKALKISWVSYIWRLTVVVIIHTPSAASATKYFQKLYAQVSNWLNYFYLPALDYEYHIIIEVRLKYWKEIKHLKEIDILKLG